MKAFFQRAFTITVPALFTFPLFKENISSLLFIIYAINVAGYCMVVKKVKIHRNIVFLTIPFWIMLITSGFHIINGTGTAKGLNIGIFFLLFPILFFNTPTSCFTLKKIKFYLNILQYSCIVIIIGYILLFLYKYNYTDFFVYQYNIPKFRDFVYTEISIFKIHPTYFTSILFLCTALSLIQAIKNSYYVGYLHTLLFVFISFMLLSKINIILLLALIFLIILFHTGLSIRKKLIGIGVFFCISLAFILYVPGIQNRFREIYISYNNPPVGLAYDSTNIRVAITKCTFNEIRENYLFGVGFDNVYDTLRSCFTKKYNNTSFYAKTNYLTHNYYAYILLSSGIIGFIAFLFYLGIVFYKLKTINNFICYAAIINILLICFTEDYLYRHYGIFYYHLIFMTFLMHSKSLPSSVE